MEYYINDFTEENYRRLVRMAKERNVFCSFDEALNKSHGIILRHDIDISVHRAVALSEIEKEEGIYSTFFIYLHSKFYNILEKQIINLLKRILSNGGLIGLHFEPGHYDLQFEDMGNLIQQVSFEKKFLENLLGTEVKYLSFHNPDIGGDWYKINDMKIGGMLNAYGKIFREDFEYCSDSNGYWRFKRLEDIFLNAKDKKIQVLLHPCWWQQEVMYPYDRVRRCIEGRAEYVLKSYNELLDKPGRVNVRG